MKKVAWIIPLAFLTSCASNGWDSLPVDGQNECFQVTEWESDGWTTKNRALGTYCKAEVPQ